MAYRTSDQLVRGVIETDLTVSVAPFIKTANALVNWLATADAADEALLNADLLREIETYVAAHLYVCNRDKQYTSKSTGGASGSFQGQYTMNLLSTDPGQTACMLDVSGKLAQRSQEAQTGQKRRATLFWMGTEYSDDGTFITDTSS
jgi:hypothetical protein